MFVCSSPNFTCIGNHSLTAHNIHNWHSTLDGLSHSNLLVWWCTIIWCGLSCKSVMFIVSSVCLWQTCSTWRDKALDMDEDFWCVGLGAAWLYGVTYGGLNMYNNLTFCDSCLNNLSQNSKIIRLHSKFPQKFIIWFSQYQKS